MIKKTLLTVIIFVITIANSYGQAKLVYPHIPPILEKGTQISPDLTPEIDQVVGPYKIAPDIHALTGLTFDTASGKISGTPSIVDSRSYTVTGTTTDGVAINTTILVHISEKKGNYSIYVAHLYVDSTVARKSITPILPKADSTKSRYSISRDLPDGLWFHTNTGEIGGTPQKAISEDEMNKPYIIARDSSGHITEYPLYIDITGYPDYVAKPATISFVGQGDIQTSLNNKSKLAANTGIGVVFRQNSSRRYGILHDIEINFSINVASTVDTIRSINDRVTNKVTNQTDFGNSVLLPLNSGQAFSFSFKGFFSERGGPVGRGNYMRNAPPRSILGVLSGMYVSVSGSNRNWEYDSITVVNDVNKITATSVKSSLLSFYVGPFFEFVTPKKSNNYGQNSSITLGMGYSGRLILGDVQQGNNTSFRTKLLGENAKKFYSGPEVMLALRFYSIKAEVHLPIFSNKHEAPGLSGTHLTTFIGFSGGFPLDLSKPNNQ